MCSNPAAHLIGGPGRLLGPVSVVPHVPPLDLQGVGGRTRPAEGTGHFHVGAALRCDVVWHLCEESWRKNKTNESKLEKMTEERLNQSWMAHKVGI